MKGGKKLRQSFVEPWWKLKTAGMQNHMCILVCCNVELAGAHGHHYDVIAAACAHEVTVGSGAKPVRLVFAGGTEPDDPNRWKAIVRLSGFLQQERAQFLHPQHPRAPRLLS